MYNTQTISLYNRWQLLVTFKRYILTTQSISLYNILQLLETIKR